MTRLPDLLVTPASEGLQSASPLRALVRVLARRCDNVPAGGAGVAESEAVRAGAAAQSVRQGRAVRVDEVA